MYIIYLVESQIIFIINNNTVYGLFKTYILFIYLN